MGGSVLREEGGRECVEGGGWEGVCRGRRMGGSVLREEDGRECVERGGWEGVC